MFLYLSFDCTLSEWHGPRQLPGSPTWSCVPVLTREQLEESNLKAPPGSDIVFSNYSSLNQLFILVRIYSLP